MKKDRKGLGPGTRLSHQQQVGLKPGNRPTVSPLYQTAKFTISPDLPLGEQFFYTRVSNPTLRELELALAELQGKPEAIVFASGVAAITGTLLALLRSGDHVIYFREIYRPARAFMRDTLSRFGVSSTALKLDDLAGLERAVIPGKTKLVYFESPSNPHLQLADIAAICDFARKHKLLTVMDGTFSGPHQHHQFPVDLFLHSLTKFVNGHGDVMAGAVMGSAELVQQIRTMAISLGATLDPHAAFLVLRGLKTYHLRYERQSLTAQRVAEFLSAHPKVRRTYYPGLPTHPRAQLGKSQMSSPGAILAFQLDPSVGTAAEFCARLHLLHFTASVGSTESLICPSLNFFGEDLGPDDRAEMGLNSYSLRLAVGLEDAQDIIADLAQALGAE
jgi:cystathionine beta-lyase/cystathionine gamma-synthase